jgi:hypothetical protein
MNTLDISGLSDYLPVSFAFNNIFDIVGSTVTIVEDITFALVASVIVPSLLASFTASFIYKILKCKTYK